VFSVVEGVLLRPRPYPDDGRIVRVGATTHTSRESAASFSDRGYWHFVNNNRSFEKFGAYRVPDSTAPLTGDGPALPVESGTMTLSAFEALGVFPELGRLPTPAEDAPGAAHVALIGHDLWVNRYGPTDQSPADESICSACRGR
jgi:putative ABC transport system permease protein